MKPSDEQLIKILHDNDVFPTKEKLTLLKKTWNLAVEKSAEEAETKNIRSVTVVDKESILKLKYT